MAKAATSSTGQIISHLNAYPDRMGDGDDNIRNLFEFWYTGIRVTA